MESASGENSKLEQGSETTHGDSDAGDEKFWQRDIPRFRVEFTHIFKGQDVRYGRHPRLATTIISGNTEGKSSSDFLGLRRSIRIPRIVGRK